MNHVHDSQETTPKHEAWVKLCQCIGTDNAWAIGQYLRAVIADELPNIAKAVLNHPLDKLGEPVECETFAEALAPQPLAAGDVPAVKGCISLEEAQESGCCRICGWSTRGPHGPENAVTLNYGKEFAHTRCLNGNRWIEAEISRRVAEAVAAKDKRIAEDDNRHQSVIDSIKGQRHAWYCEIQVARGKCNCGMQLAAKDAEIERLKASHSDFATDMRRQIVNLEAELAECRKPVEDERSFFASDANNNVQEVVGVLRFRAERNARVAAERELDGLREAVNKYAMEVARSKRGDTESFYIMDGRGAESSSPTDAVLAAYRAEKAKGQP